MKQQAIASVTVAKMALTARTLSSIPYAHASLTSSLPMNCKAHPAPAPLAPRDITKTVECGTMQHAKSAHTPRLTRMMAPRGVVARLVLSITFLNS